MQWSISDARRRAHIREDALAAARSARVADPAAVLDEQMGQHGPALLWKQWHERPFDLHGIALLRETETVAEPRDMCVHDDAVIFPEGITEDHVGRLASHTGQLHECVHVGGHLACVA